MPTPPPMSRHSARASGAASRRRGNHSRGTLISRPSTRRTINASAVQRASTARGSYSILAAEELIPALLKEHVVLDDGPSYLGQLGAAKAVRASEPHRVEPDLGVTLAALDANMSRLPALIAEKKKR